MTRDASGRTRPAGPGAGHPRPAADGRALREAIQHHRAGRLGEAERLYRAVLQSNPDHPDALNLLGMIAHQAGRPAAGLPLVERAIAIDGRSPEYQNNAGLLLLRLGRVEEATARFRRALLLDPGHGDAHLNLGGLALREGRPAEAVPHFKAALKRRGERFEAHHGLGAALLQLGRWQEAAESLRAALRLRPPSPEILYDLANALREAGEASQAEACYRQALALRPDFVEAHGNLARALSDQGRIEEAERHYRRAAELRPDEAQAHFNLGVALERLDRLAEAEASYGRALALQPASGPAMCNLGGALLAQGRVYDAVDTLRRALAAQPDLPQAASSLLMALCYDDRPTPQKLAAEHRRLARVFEPPAAARATGPSATRDGTGRRLRIGYVSADFRRHSCAYFLEPLLAAHDRDAVEVCCYSDVAFPDAVTARLQALAHRWRVIAGADDAAVAAQIEADGIDVLVDLHGHTAGHRLALFARRPAPANLSWLGYPFTTGLAAMDFRITDARADPDGVTDALHTERLLRLAGGFLCYGPPPEAPPVEPGPALRGGPLTFGSFNAAPKLSPSAARLWAAILRAVPGSRLLLKAKAFADPPTRARFAAALAAAGAPAESVELRPWAATAEEALAAYREVDIALDPFPYNGTTTTCEALWMGVPVIALAGAAHAGRVGASLLHMAGLPELVAANPGQYLAKAVTLAGDAARRSALRFDLRARLRRSALLDAGRFAREFEAACRGAWQAAQAAAAPPA